MTVSSDRKSRSPISRFTRPSATSWSTSISRAVGSCPTSRLAGGVNGMTAPRRPELRLAEALRLPTFEFEGRQLYKRLALVAEEGRIAKVFYPVFPPDENAADVLAWLRER